MNIDKLTEALERFHPLDSPLLFQNPPDDSDDAYTLEGFTWSDLKELVRQRNALLAFAKDAVRNPGDDGYGDVMEWVDEGKTLTEDCEGKI